MGIGKVINNFLKPLGVEIGRIEPVEGTAGYKNRYDLVPDEIDGLNREARKIVNLLHYTKQADTTYNAEKYSAGYHEIQLGDQTLTGQRAPGKRLEIVPYDFSGKTVLDLGCNQGGMLHAIADKISAGVGLEFDTRLVNAANRIKAYKGAGNLDFYVFDLENENLDLIDNFLPEKIDIVFLLSVCMWISTWKEVINKAHLISKTMLFESNGTPDQQDEQYEVLRATYNSVQLLQDSSPDDPRQKKRRLYFCEG